MKVQELVTTQTITVGTKELYITAKLKAKHLIYIEKAFPKVGDIEKGLRLLALLLLESMGTAAPSYDELIEETLEDLAPLLEVINSNAVSKAV